LFIDRGPIVQLRNTNGRIEVLDDPMPEKVFDGPLLVLVNRFSASASEIFAAAIQDYNRGVVVGQQTFGKGTVQNLYPLDRYAPGRDPQFGQLTLTIGKYYRVTGGSTQHRGVIPDIELPSAVDSDLVGESSRDSALPWDQIEATRYKAYAPLQAAVEVLTDGQKERSVGNPDYLYLVDDIEDQRVSQAHKSVSLSLEQRKRDREETTERQLERLNKRRASLGLEPAGTLEDVSADEVPDVILETAAAIVADMSDLPAASLAENRSE
jgi:carboxyl-terminal processing protease